MKIVCISDTHNLHRGLDLPAGDILIHAGDFTKFGELEHLKVELSKNIEFKCLGAFYGLNVHFSCPSHLVGFQRVARRASL